MRPSGTTAAASVKISAAPPVAILPRWTKCQSSAKPSRALYWHIGDMTTRFLSVILRSAMGENKSGCDAIGFLFIELWREQCRGMQKRNSCVRPYAGCCKAWIRFAAVYARDIDAADACGHPFRPAQH